MQDFNAFQKHFKQAERDNREYCNSVEQHEYGMGADESAANEMTKILTDLANALQQTETANGATGQAENNSVLEQTKNNIVIL